MKPTNQSKENVQYRILNAAEELFASSSYSATRISDIAVKAGANQALVHYYFHSKEQLYQAVLERLFTQWESYLFKQNWEDMLPNQMLKRYIEAHFEMKCKVPNLYKIFHKESIDGGQLFNQFASDKWTQDYNEKRAMFKQWKKVGIIDTQLNEQVILFCIWGMMNQFYYREQQALQMITGEEGSLSELRADIVNQMVAVVQHGILKSPSNEVHSIAKSLKQITLFVAASEFEQLEEEKHIVTEMFQNWNQCHVNIIYSADQLTNENQLDMLFILTNSKYGELSSELVKLLGAIEQNKVSVTDCFVGIWTAQSGHASDTVQEQLESIFNHNGGFVVSKPDTITLHGYLNRCAKMSKL